jgi:hypothetical protein
MLSSMNAEDAASFADKAILLKKEGAFSLKNTVKQATDAGATDQDVALLKDESTKATRAAVTKGQQAHNAQQAAYRVGAALGMTQENVDTMAYLFGDGNPTTANIETVNFLSTKIVPCPACGKGVYEGHECVDSATLNSQIRDSNWNPETSRVVMPIGNRFSVQVAGGGDAGWRVAAGEVSSRINPKTGRPILVPFASTETVNSDAGAEEVVAVAEKMAAKAALTTPLTEYVDGYFRTAEPTEIAKMRPYRAYDPSRRNDTSYVAEYEKVTAQYTSVLPWRNNGFTASDAAQWSKSGFALSADAGAWTDSGWTISEFQSVYPEGLRAHSLYADRPVKK